MTNYDKIKPADINSMADLITRAHVNHCGFCVHDREKDKCVRDCFHGIKEWLAMEVTGKEATCLKCSQWKSGACRKPYDMPCKYDYEQLLEKVKK